MNLISETHYSFERREYAFMVLREYTIISRASHTYTPRLGYSRNSFLYIKKKKKVLRDELFNSLFMKNELLKV